MARRVPPSFDFFADDFVAGTYHMEAEAVGIYLRLLCYQWSNGSIPSDESALARIAGIDAVAMRRHMPEVMRKFETDSDGRIKNARLEVERSKKMLVIEKAKASANKRWNKQKTSNAVESQSETPSSTDAVAMRSDMPTHSEPICSLLPTSNVLLPTDYTHTHSEFLDVNIVCPDWLKPEFCRWLAYRFARDAVKVDAISQELLAQELVRRGEEKATKDIRFSILKQAKNILDSNNDFERGAVAKGSAPSGNRFPQRETSEESFRRMFENDNRGS
jgi:uncharacterized protein YdaU (DUF1376 family)